MEDGVEEDNELYTQKSMAVRPANNTAVRTPYSQPCETKKIPFA